MHLVNEQCIARHSVAGNLSVLRNVPAVCVCIDICMRISICIDMCIRMYVYIDTYAHMSCITKVPRLQTQCNTMQHNATHCNAYVHMICITKILQLRDRVSDKVHFVTSSHTATHCNTLQHTTYTCITKILRPQTPTLYPQIHPNHPFLLLILPGWSAVVAVCCSVLQCVVAVCCSVKQCVEECRRLSG